MALEGALGFRQIRGIRRLIEVLMPKEATKRQKEDLKRRGYLRGLPAAVSGGSNILLGATGIGRR